MTPTVQTLGEKIHQQLVNAGVSDCAHAVRVLALHARRTRLTREQLVDLLSRFEPGEWDLGTTTAAERLLQDRGETPDAELLAYEVGHLHGRILLHGAPPWPADDAGPAEVADAALAETPGPGRDGEDRPSAREWLHDRCQVDDHDGCPGAEGAQGCDCACHLPGDEAAETAAPEPDPWAERATYFSMDGLADRLVVSKADVPTGARIVLRTFSCSQAGLWVAMTAAQARAIGRDLIAAADEVEAARDDTVGEQR